MDTIFSQSPRIHEFARLCNLVRIRFISHEIKFKNPYIKEVSSNSEIVDLINQQMVIDLCLNKNWNVFLNKCKKILPENKNWVKTIDYLKEVSLLARPIQEDVFDCNNEFMEKVVEVANNNYGLSFEKFEYYDLN